MRDIQLHGIHSCDHIRIGNGCRLLPARTMQVQCAGDKLGSEQLAQLLVQAASMALAVV